MLTLILGWSVTEKISFENKNANFHVMREVNEQEEFHKILPETPIA